MASRISRSSSTARSTRISRAATLLAGTAVLAVLAACGSDSGDTATAPSPIPTSTEVTPGTTVTLVTYDSFELSKKTLKAFEDQTGIKVKVLQNGDAGKALNTAILTKNRPQGDVLFGVDDSSLSKALDEDIFEPYLSPELENVDEKFVIDPEHRVTPIQHGSVCVDYDKAWFEDKGIAPPASLADLTKPEYDELLVVQNPATSTPGLSFLLATIAEFGEDGYEQYWSDLRENGVQVTPGWDEAYYTYYTAGAEDGTRPIVVSYSTDPAAAVDFAEEELTEAPTAVIEDTCYGSIEFAGVLENAKNPEAGRALINFLLGPEVQKDIPPNMYVYPVRTGTPLPKSFVEFVSVPQNPLSLDADLVGENREAWTRTWQATVLD
jgi:thiamine transport system substrate-binding protein